MYDTIDEIIEANEAAGQFFFSPDTMAFFDSRVEDDVYGGEFFVTSEQLHRKTIIGAMPEVFAVLGVLPEEADRDHVEPRQWAVHRIRESGSIDNLDRAKYDTLEEAIEAAERFAAEQETRV